MQHALNVWNDLAEAKRRWTEKKKTWNQEPFIERGRLRREKRGRSGKLQKTQLYQHASHFFAFVHFLHFPDSESFFGIFCISQTGSHFFGIFYISKPGVIFCIFFPRPGLSPSPLPDPYEKTTKNCNARK